ncbi:MAG: type II toxin-antitoxin system HipA family toxin [Pseudomonadota bacterium]|nr:type II toxin-antitoxin system HipA family toxin [Pseudomonadota bacterium]
MTDENALNVWCNTSLAGRIECNSAGIISFRYDIDWILNGFPLSQQLPLKNTEYTAEEGMAHKFFVNLLPEADARMHLIRDLKIANSDFELLKALGGECAGAFSLLQIDQKPNNKSSYKKLSNAELTKILERKGQVFSLTSANDRPRLSLAGAQDKCPLFFDEHNYYLPKEAAPSSHILKFEIAGYKNIPLFEYYMTKLAESVGLPVVNIELYQNNRDHYLVIKRYDRVIKNNQLIERLHQEDFCQALGVSYAKKYEQSGGPSFKDCYNLTREITISPISALENLLRWQIYNVLAGNSDGHAKNLAILYNESNQATLAPFYDLVCTRAIERIDNKLAMSVGGEFNPSTVTLLHWGLLANDCDISYQYLKSTLKSMAEALLENLPTTLKEFETKFGPCPALQRMQMIVIKQCNKLLKQF